MTLNDLHTGDSANIVRIRGRGAFRQRLTEMGFIRGKPVTVLKSAPLKDPVKYRILDSNVSLRRSEASLIEVVPEAEFQRISTPSYGWITDSIQRVPFVPRPGRTINVALVGNPNCGKTTLFNRVVPTISHRGKGIYRLLNHVINVFEGEDPDIRHIHINFYLPCIAVIAAVGRESGSWKWAGFVLFYTTVIAWAASLFVYQIGSLLQM